MTKQRHRKRNRQRIHEIKAQPCADCGQTYPPYVMDFDHRDPSTKRKTVSQLVKAGLQQVLDEVAKCDVVCANCHRMRTYKRRHYLRSSR